MASTTTQAAPDTPAPRTEMIPIRDVQRWEGNPVRPAAGKVGPRFQIVAGERRWRAAALAGLTHIPAIVRPMDDAKALEIAVVENEQRDNLNPLEAADGYLRLMKEHKYTAEDIASKLGKSRGFVYGRLRLAGLPPAAKKALVEERGAARRKTERNTTGGPPRAYGTPSTAASSATTPAPSST